MSDWDKKSLDRLERAAAGDDVAFSDLLAEHEPRLLRMIRLQMNPQLRGRVDAADVLQEALLEISKNLATYLQDTQMPFFLWLRHIVSQKLIDVHRFHLGAQMRDARREISLHNGAFPEATSASLAAHLIGRITTPSVAAQRAELKLRLQEVLNQMEPLDREVLALRHFEQLSNSETARELQIRESAASKRYVRALDRLSRLLGETPDMTW